MLGPEQEQFARDLAVRTGLHFQSVAAWCLCEQPGTADVGHNWLDLLSRSLGRSVGFSGVAIAGYSASGFARFYSLTDALAETGYWVNRMSNYQGIRASRGKTPQQQVAAIAASPWDAGHYGNGRTIATVLADVLRAYPLAPAPRLVRFHYTRRDGTAVVTDTQHPGRFAIRHWHIFWRGDVSTRPIP